APTAINCLVSNLVGAIRDRRYNLSDGTLTVRTDAHGAAVMAGYGNGIYITDCIFLKRNIGLVCRILEWFDRKDLENIIIERIYEMKDVEEKLNDTNGVRRMVEDYVRETGDVNVPEALLRAVDPDGVYFDVHEHYDLLRYTEY